MASPVPSPADDVGNDVAPHPRSVPVPRWLLRLAGFFAGVGGLVLLAMMLMTVLSVTLRGVTGRPIPGDYELVELASAIAIFCFLPWCQISGGNVLVDFFTTRAPVRVNHLLGAAADLIYLALAVFLSWRLSVGAAEIHRYAEQTMVLRLPVWTSFVVILPAMAVLVLTTAATLLGHLRQARS